MLNRQELEFPSIAVAVTDTLVKVDTLTFGEAEGRCCNRYVISIPTFTVTTATTTLIVKNRRGKVTFTGAALAHAVDYAIPVWFDIHSGDQIYLSFSLAPGGSVAYNIYLSLHLSV